MNRPAHLLPPVFLWHTSGSGEKDVLFLVAFTCW